MIGHYDRSTETSSVVSGRHESGSGSKQSLFHRDEFGGDRNEGGMPAVVTNHCSTETSSVVTGSRLMAKFVDEFCG